MSQAARKIPFEKFEVWLWCARSHGPFEIGKEYPFEVYTLAYNPIEDVHGVFVRHYMSAYGNPEGVYKTASSLKELLQGWKVTGGNAIDQGQAGHYDRPKMVEVLMAWEKQAQKIWKERLLDCEENQLKYQNTSGYVREESKVTEKASTGDAGDAGEPIRKRPVRTAPQKPGGSSGQSRKKSKAAGQQGSPVGVEAKKEKGTKTGEGPGSNASPV